MNGKSFLTVLVLTAVSGCVFSVVQAQTDERKMEIGGQFTLLRLSTGSAGITPVTNDQNTEPGFGGRFGYNINKYFAVETEGNFFPRDREFEGGRKAQFVAGVKAGGRSEKFGIFAKARPGFLHLSQGDYRFVSGTGCVAIFPEPIECFQPTSKTNFAFDAGGVVEVYPSARSIVRFDVGDTIVRYGTRNVAGLIGPPGPTRIVVLQVGPETVHNFQASIGVGYRF